MNNNQVKVLLVTRGRQKNFQKGGRSNAKKYQKIDKKKKRKIALLSLFQGDQRKR